MLKIICCLTAGDLHHARKVVLVLLNVAVIAKSNNYLTVGFVFTYLICNFSQMFRTDLSGCHLN